MLSEADDRIADGGGVRAWAPYALIAAVGVVAAVVSVVWPMAALDTFSRYAPMAEAFARGDWKEALHPRFGLLFPLLAGLVSKLGLDGYRACTLVSTLAWGVAMVPLFRMTRRTFGMAAAVFAVVLYAICPQTLVWAFKGFRDSFRLLGVLLMVSGAVGRLKDERAGFAEAAAGAAVLILSRGDAVLQAAFLWLVFAFVDRFRLKTWILAGTTALVLQAPCWLVWSWTGSWLPAYEAVWMFRRWFGD